MGLRCLFGHKYDNFLNVRKILVVFETIEGLRTGEQHDAVGVISFYICKKCKHEYAEATDGNFTTYFDNPIVAALKFNVNEYEEARKKYDN